MGLTQRTWSFELEEKLASNSPDVLSDRLLGVVVIWGYLRRAENAFGNGLVKIVDHCGWGAANIDTLEIRLLYMSGVAFRYTLYRSVMHIA